ncbi:hypothetical protein B0I00_1522 [Novosphingobium kunmingense]|uniref:Nodulation protein Z n=1 Tax=Novosphingobium kunmingense TaxID=1211806 RepID=A0A2N0HK15_9SPHN|nr:hypothetical protein [Novosphingobium kunmingense]PKB19291.1 hypothetical protein B0I00_1522 [Novosphingobium kunmingense]
MTVPPTDADLVQAVAARLDRLVAEAPRTVVFLPYPCGLGGQISGRVHTLLLALALDRRPVFLRSDDPPYAQTFAGEPAPAPVGTVVPARLDAAQDDSVVCYDAARALPFDDALLLPLVSAKLAVAVPDRLALEGAALAWLRPTLAMATFCESERERLGVGGHCLGVHLRRGDKAVETAFVPAAELNRHIARIQEDWPFEALFLASDSPDAAAEIECPPGVALIFDRDEQRFNNANHKMLVDNPALAEQETRSAYKNIALLSACGGIVGQDNAHFATLAAGAIRARGVPPSRIALIDGRVAERASPAVSALFAVKKRLRALARRLLPHWTMEARMKRRKG